MQNLWRRNIHIKRFEGIPIADTELIFPEKKIFLKPITILQLAVTVIGGLIAAFVTLWGVRPPPFSFASCFCDARCPTFSNGPSWCAGV